VHDLLISYIRTFVPVAVGSVATWLLTLGVELDAETQAAAVTAGTGVLIAVYYVVARALERKWPAFGFLLGSQVEPEYAGRGKRIAGEHAPTKRQALSDDEEPDDSPNDNSDLAEDY